MAIQVKRPVEKIKNVVKGNIDDRMSAIMRGLNSAMYEGLAGGGDRAMVVGQG